MAPDSDLSISFLILSPVSFCRESDKSKGYKIIYGMASECAVVGIFCVEDYPVLYARQHTWVFQTYAKCVELIHYFWYKI